MKISLHMSEKFDFLYDNVFVWKNKNNNQSFRYFICVAKVKKKIWNAQNEMKFFHFFFQKFFLTKFVLQFLKINILRIFFRLNFFFTKFFTSSIFFSNRSERFQFFIIDESLSAISKSLQSNLTSATCFTHL